jgi:hypothetical protein
MGTLEYWPCMPCIILEMIIRRMQIQLNISWNLQRLVAQQPYLSKPPLQASITKKGWFLAPLLLLRGEQDASQGQISSLQPLWCKSNSIADELEHP